jgi:hypothetical protein
MTPTSTVSSSATPWIGSTSPKVASPMPPTPSLNPSDAPRHAPAQQSDVWHPRRHRVCARRPSQSARSGSHVHRLRGWRWSAEGRRAPGGGSRVVRDRRCAIWWRRVGPMALARSVPDRATVGHTSADPESSPHAVVDPCPLGMLLVPCAPAGRRAVRCWAFTSARRSR